MATKKITKKTIVNKVEEVSNETPSVTKKAVTKKIDRSILSNITNIDDLYSLIRDTYNETAEKNITKDDVAGIMNAFKTAFQNFATNSDSDQSTFIIPEIGRFTVYVVQEHESINPKTMEKVTVPTKKRIRFKAFPRFVKIINGIED